MTGALKKNGIIQFIPPGHVPLEVHKDPSGGIRLILGSLSTVLSPRKTIEIACAMLQGVGVGLEESSKQKMIDEAKP